MNRRIFVKTLVVGLTAVGSGCFGSFKATSWLYGLNKGISGNKFIQWLVFLVLVILPAYELAAIIDVLILNSLEFWFGKGVAQNESDERVVMLDNGDMLTLRKDVSAGTLSMVIDRGGRSTTLVFQMSDQRAVVRGAGGVIASARSAEGGVEVRAGDFVEFHSAESVRGLLDAYDSRQERGVAAWARASVSANRTVASR